MADDFTFIRDFEKVAIDSVIRSYRRTSPQKLEENGFFKALSLFQEAAMRVPAYKDFLKRNSIRPEMIKTYEDFQAVPVMDKKNYLQKYSLKELCWDGNFKNLYIFSSSSGSTGKPSLWPRGEEQEVEGALIHEVILKHFFQAGKRTTLFINCFSMGTWIAGVFSLTCMEFLSRKGYDITSITPGLEKDVTFSLFKRLASEFDQIIFCGYPPFIKDIIDAGEQYEVDWKKYKIKFLFAAEGFSEAWRAYMHKKIGADEKEITSISIYGSADATALANETPLTILIRKLLDGKTEATKTLFGQSHLPTLAQYDPNLKFFEEVNGNLIFTTRSGIPLVRYDIGDDGGVYAKDALVEKLKGLDVHITSALSSFNRSYDFQLPLVYLYGRQDLTVSFYALLIYPEHIKFGIEKEQFQSFITGKFVLSTEYDHVQNPYLLIRIELAKDVKATDVLRSKIQKSVIAGLKKVNSEYHRLYEAIGEKALPTIELIEHGNTDYFRSGVKQRWIKM